jgi:hypothetical protein
MDAYTFTPPRPHSRVRVVFEGVVESASCTTLTLANGVHLDFCAERGDNSKLAVEVLEEQGPKLGDLGSCPVHPSGRELVVYRIVDREYGWYTAQDVCVLGSRVRRIDPSVAAMLLAPENAEADGNG